MRNIFHTAFSQDVAFCYRNCREPRPNIADIIPPTGNYTFNVPQYTLRDIRDGNSYVVRKLADGNCWMTENLRLALSTGVSVVASKNDGSTFTFTPTSCSTNGACAMNGHTRLYNGNWYYTWYAATAGEGKADSTADINGSICPIRWKLPYSYANQTQKSYGNLLQNYGISPDEHNSTSEYAILEALPFDYLRAGYFWNGSWIGGPTGGALYWSSQAYPDNVKYARYFTFNPSFVWSDNYRAEKYDGFTLRCVAL